MRYEPVSKIYLGCGRRTSAKPFLRRVHETLFLGIALAALAAPLFASAEPNLEELRASIEEKNSEIQRLEEEARQFREAAESQRAIGTTLKNELGRIDREVARLRREIAVTERQIEKTRFEIDAASFEIREKEDSIARMRVNLAALIRLLNERSEEPLVAVLIKNDFLSDFFRELDSVQGLQGKIVRTLNVLYDLRRELKVKKAEAETKHEKLSDFQDSLGDQRKVTESAQRSKNELLAATKNQERKFQELLEEAEQKRVELEREILAIEQTIRVIIDPSTLPEKGSGVLGYPLPETALVSCWRPNGVTLKNCVTQFFGDTDFARAGGYDGKGHNGADFRADVGTPVFSAERGSVEAVGDTDVGCRRASYGKWILIRHPNNLSTLYAHLSAVSVSSGQEVDRGTRIALSGRSGYATGPHLHFTVFATQAVRIESIRSKVCGRMMTLPIAALNGYLNPLDYL